MAQASAKAASEKTIENNPFEAMTNFDVEPFKVGYEKAAENFSQFAEFQKETFDAFMKSSNACVKGMDKLSAENAAFLKSFFDDGVAAAKGAIPILRSLQQ